MLPIVWWGRIVWARSGQNFLDGFETPDRRFHFKPDWSRVGPDYAKMPDLPDYLAVGNDADAEHPFRLVAAPARQFLNTSSSMPV